jgi:hypothetical protein
MRKTTSQTRDNRTITVDFHDERTYFTEHCMQNLSFYG